jgi:putative ABC transport system ATP-binding protein
MIELRDVRKVFCAGRADEVTAVAGVSLAVETGSVTVFTGPSGSGKTTLLALVGCMARPTAGRIWVRGREVTSLPERFLTAVRRRTFGFVFQKLQLLPGISTLENVMLPAYPLGENRPALLRRAEALLASLGIAGRASAPPESLSGGEAQRVAIARALINDPEAIIADEPTAHLDSKLAGELVGILGLLRDRGKTVIVASHDPVVHEASIVDRVVRMRDGRVEGEGR